MSRRDMRLRPTPPEVLDRLSEVSPSDAERARQRWKDVTLPQYRGLADATEVVDDDVPA